MKRNETRAHAICHGQTLKSPREGEGASRKRPRHASTDTKCPETGKSTEFAKQKSGCQGLGAGEWGVTAHGDRVSFWGDGSRKRCWLHDTVNVRNTTELRTLNGDVYGTRILSQLKKKKKSNV